jgi:hypothetical protein
MAMAQYGTKTYIKDGRQWTVSYFTAGQKSTEVSYAESDSRWKKITAYDRTGHVIYETNYGQRYGSSHVDVRYYPDGAVYRTHYTMQPDGGIQYTDITTYYAPDGKVDHEEDNSIGNEGVPLLRTMFSTGPCARYTSAYLAEASRMYAGAISHGCLSDSTIPVSAFISESQYKDIAGGPAYYDVDPADTVRIGAHYATPMADPLDHYSLYVETKPRNGFGYYINYWGMASSNRQYVLVTCHRSSKNE